MTNLDQQIQEAQARLAEKMAEQKRLQAEQAAQEATQAASNRVLDGYLKDRAYQDIRLGQPNKGVNRAYATSPDRALDLAILAVTNPLFGLVRLNGQYSFNGTAYSTLRDATSAISSFTGLPVSPDQVLEILYASLEDDLSQPAYRRAAVDRILKGQTLGFPEGLTWQDDQKLQAILGTLTL